jgi:hypothetical protein
MMEIRALRGQPTCRLHQSGGIQSLETQEQRGLLTVRVVFRGALRANGATEPLGASPGSRVP